ncbi:curli-like amyloid fiber formation chaperone CsgH [Lutibacter citreus]|uniref:curli-like amyloid fiber formation chaperone CsgH n=1 Tax=Lutibacter citreus TaxID=2138210 RepID=UPI000DBE7A0E|nr:curli-like amyloid fiber formation chaperone CsgH [Lutibacter citreus]
MKLFLLNIVFGFFILFNVEGQINESVIGKINIKEVDNLILIKGQAENGDEVFKDRLNYSLLALKKSSTGNYSSNNQQGEFSLDPNENKVLSEIRLNIEKGEELKIYLFIKQNDKVIAKDSLIITPAENKNIGGEVKKEVDFELKGIVVDEVITKVGKDFHDYFYQAYNTSGNQYPFIITIKEKPYFGRSSIITIISEDKTLFEFMSKPDEEFLKSAVKASLQRVSQYAKQRKMLYKNSRI